MLPWWCILIAVLVGVFFGVFLMALCAANTNHGKKWWEDE